MIDCHVHSNSESIAECSIYPSGVSLLIQGGTDRENWRLQTNLRRSSPIPILTCFGFHPAYLGAGLLDDDIDELRLAMEHGDLLGECGLDFRPEVLKKVPAALQVQAFDRQWQLARDLAKPVVLHVVRSHTEVLVFLKKTPPRTPFMVHAFRSSGDIAKQYLELGGYLSLGQGVLSSNGETLRNLVPRLPLERILLESDGPQPGCNSLEVLRQVYERVAELRGITYQELVAAVRRNVAVFAGTEGEPHARELQS